MSVKFNFPKIARDSGFKLQQFKDGTLDWGFIGSLEIDKILRKQQFEPIDAVLLQLSEAPLAACLLESNILDSGVTKFFILSQFALQYLIFCRKFLDETVRTLRDSIIHLETENANLKTMNHQQNNEIINLNKKISQIEAINEIIFPCQFCTKNFVSNDALNLHLSKKHLKTNTVDVQGMDNDRSLINTIKLELEIKHLKERLNIAEKDIRETLGSKKTSPREEPKICKSTQAAVETKNFGTQMICDLNVTNNITSRDVGLQSNLCETKESDCTDTEYIEKQSKLSLEKENNNAKANKNEKIIKLQEKISELETWQKSNNSNNQQSINDITQKLNEIKESLENRVEEDVKNIITQVAKDAILSSISANQIATTSADELHTILSNMCSEVLNMNSNKLDNFLTRIEKNYDEKICLLEAEIKKRGKLTAKQVAKPLSSTSKFDVALDSVQFQQSKEHITLDSTHSAQTYSIEMSLNEISSDDNNKLNERSSSESQIGESSKSQSSNLKYTSSKETSTEKYVVMENYAQKMKLYGLSTSTEGISVSEAARISAHLSESRNSLKKVYPRFYATRNRLLQFVNKLSSKEKLNATPLQTLNDKSNKKVRIRSDLKKNDFKQKLELILNSPVKKPSSYLASKSKEQNHSFPMPRKQVMFYNGD